MVTLRWSVNNQLIFSFQNSQFLKIALINSVNKKVVSVDILVSVVPIESQNKYYIRISLLYSFFDVTYIYSANRCLRTEIIHKKISRKLLQQLKVRHMTYWSTKSITWHRLITLFQLQLWKLLLGQSLKKGKTILRWRQLDIFVVRTRLTLIFGKSK